MITSIDLLIYYEDSFQSWLPLIHSEKNLSILSLLIFETTNLETARVKNCFLYTYSSPRLVCIFYQELNSVGVGSSEHLKKCSYISNNGLSRCMRHFHCDINPSLVELMQGLIYHNDYLI